MGALVIACYRPLPGKESELRAAVKDHLPTLRRLGFATERKAIVGRAKDGTIVEVFEWVSEEAVRKAHEDPDVQGMWGRFSACCSLEKVASLEECQQLFPHFEPLDL